MRSRRSVLLDPLWSGGACPIAAASGPEVKAKMALEMPMLKNTAQGEEASW
jgi:hypothetical protein